MLLIHTFFRKTSKALFGTTETKSTSKKRTRTLGIEELESRDLLSASPLDWSPWETAPLTDTVPAYYNTDPTSDDFGVVCVGGNDSPISATTAIAPVITGNFSAFETVTRQGSITTLDDNNTALVLGSYQETFTVGIFSQDLGNGDWSYLEQVGYSYSCTSTDEFYQYEDGYSYTLTTSFIDGVYQSTFVLTTGYGFTDGFSIGEEPDEVTDEDVFFWKISLEYSVTNTATISHTHNTLTAELSGTDVRTSHVISSYDEGGRYVEDDTSYVMHDISWSDSFSETNVYYQWNNGTWLISGDATATGELGYDWGETLDTTHATGTLYVSEGSSHDEHYSATWFYDSIADSWVAIFVSGEGGGDYDYVYKWDSDTTYERAFYDSTITGTENAYIDYRIDEDWDVSFCIVNGLAVREIEGGYTAIYKSGSSYEGGGSHSESKTTSTPHTAYVGYQAYQGILTTEYEREASLSESGSQTYSETITGNWSSKANAQGQLVWTELADAVVTVTADGFYDCSLSVFSSSNFESSYNNGYSSGYYHATSESKQLTELSEDYSAEMTEHWHSDGGAFALMSFVGSASGGGRNYAPSSTEHTSEFYNEWNYSSGCDGGCGCGCGCGAYTHEYNEDFTTSCREHTYDYTADWGGANGSTFGDVANHVTGNVENISGSTWHYSGCGYSSNGGDSCSSCGCGAYDSYDEMLSRTGWRDATELALTPFAARWSPFTGSVYDSSIPDDSGCDDNACLDYDYSSWGASFRAPNFSASIWDNVYDYGTHIERDAGVYISDPGGSGGWTPTCVDGNCFTAGTQVVVGVEYDANDVFIQYVTVNIEDIKVGDLVYSYDTITGEVSLKEVTDVIVRETDHINYLTIEDEHGNEQVIAVTDAHPFWVVTDEPDLERAARSMVDENGVILYHENLEPGLNGFWVEAKDLREGDVVLGANGELSTVMALERVEFPDGITVYNFTVDGNHNYFVLAETDEFGQTCILVHNSWGAIYHLLMRLLGSRSISPADIYGAPDVKRVLDELNEGVRKHLEELEAMDAPTLRPGPPPSRPVRPTSSPRPRPSPIPTPAPIAHEEPPSPNPTQPEPWTGPWRPGEPIPFDMPDRPPSRFFHDTRDPNPDLE